MFSTFVPVIMIVYLVFIIIPVIISLVAWQQEWLSASGAIAASMLGTIILFSGGWLLSVPMITFFITSSILSKLPSRISSKDLKNNKPRDFVQVACNGGIAGIAAILYLMWRDPVYIILYYITIAISTSDTWSSEAGIFFKGRVVDISTFKEVEKGLSGGISIFGTLAGFIGSLSIGLLYLCLERGPISTCILIILAGFTGMILDSFLGSFFQVKYIDKHKEIFEYKVPDSKKVKGYSWFNNDMVNVLSNAIITILVYAYYLQLN